MRSDARAQVVETAADTYVGAQAEVGGRLASGPLLRPHGPEMVMRSREVL